MAQHLMAHLSPLTAHAGLRFARSATQILANTRHRSVQLETAEAQIVRLSRCVFAHLLDAVVAPSLSLVGCRFQGPRGRAARFVEGAIIVVRKEGGPREAVL